MAFRFVNCHGGCMDDSYRYECDGNWHIDVRIGRIFHIYRRPGVNVMQSHGSGNVGPFRFAWIVAESYETGWFDVTLGNRRLLSITLPRKRR